MIQIHAPSSYSKASAVAESTTRSRKSLPHKKSNDAVRISHKKREERGRSLALDWSSSMRFKAHEKKGQQALERMAKILPKDSRQRPRPELFTEPDNKVRLTDAAERLLMEGLEGGAKVAFQDAIDALYQQYAEDLKLDEADFAEARESVIRDAKKLLADFSVKPWSPYDQASNVSIDSLGKALEEKVQRHRQMVLESSGDFSRVLSELTVNAKEGDEVDLIRLGDFVIRFTEALDARTTSTMRNESREEMLGSHVQEISDEALEMGKAFLEFLHNMRA